MSGVNLFEQAAGSLGQNSPYLELYILDATILGGGVSYFTQGPLNGGELMFGGQAYQFLPIETNGFDYPGTGPLPTPTIKLSNQANVPMGLLIAFDDLRGATVTRMKTYQMFLDGQPEANVAYVSTPDIYRVERKSYASFDYVELELASALDVQGRQLPFRVVLQGACTQTYRYWDQALDGGAGGFVYTNASCPYTGDLYFDLSDNPTTANLDNCARKLQSCNNRFNPPDTNPINPLPTRAFPGASTQGFG